MAYIGNMDKKEFRKLLAAGGTPKDYTQNPNTKHKKESTALKISVLINFILLTTLIYNIGKI